MHARMHACTHPTAQHALRHTHRTGKLARWARFRRRCLARRSSISRTTIPSRLTTPNTSHLCLKGMRLLGCTPAIAPRRKYELGRESQRTRPDNSSERESPRLRVFVFCSLFSLTVGLGSFSPRADEKVPRSSYQPAHVHHFLMACDRSQVPAPRLQHNATQCSAK